MLAGLERRKRHGRVIGDRRIDVDGIDLVVLEEVGIGLVPPLDAIRLADLVEFVPRPLADRHQFRVRVALVDGDELGAEAEADDGGANPAEVRVAEVGHSPIPSIVKLAFYQHFTARAGCP